MATASQISDDLKLDETTFCFLLRAIVKGEPKVGQKLAQTYASPKLPLKGGFWCRKSLNSKSRCDCWYDLEYYGFIKGKIIDVERLDTVCESLERGKCIHMVEQEGREIDDSKHAYYSSTTLMHAAAASGNVSAVQFLTCRYAKFKHVSTKKCLKPFHLAVIKGQSEVLHYLLEGNHRNSQQSKDFLLEAVELLNRDSNTGKILECVKARELKKYSYPHFHLLAMSNITDVEAMEKIIDTGAVDVHHLLIFLMLNNAFSAAATLVATKLWKFNYKISKQTNFQIEIITCVLCDADVVLDALINENVNIKFKTDKYNLLDVANAFGSQKCASILKLHMQATENVHRLFSPFNFLFFIVEDRFPCCYDAFGLLKRCVDQGYDVKYTDEYIGCNPLSTAIRRGSLTFIGPLLELGADINVAHRNATVIDDILNYMTDSHTRRDRDISFVESIFKELLYHKPLPSKTKNALVAAVQCDSSHPELMNIHSNKTIRFKAVDGVDDGEDLLSNTTADRFLAVSTFAVLYELGFKSQESCEDYIQQAIDTLSCDLVKPMRIRRFKQHEHEISKYKLLQDCILNVKSQPHSLKSSCRIAIRKAHTGRRLQEYISVLHLPSSLFQYIVRPYFLRPVVVDDESMIARSSVVKKQKHTSIK